VAGVKVLQAISEWSGRLLSWLTFFMVAVTFVVVVLRYGFGMGWIALQESVVWMHGLVLMLGSAYTLRYEAHVRVDVFYRLFEPRTRALVDLAGTMLLLFPVCGFILWSSWGYVADSWALGESSREAGGLPALYLLKTAIPAAAILLACEGIVMTIRSWHTLKKAGADL
jgi:TRAP-type mannitol/chloroaromatic compound transport system permease small subunit